MAAVKISVVGETLMSLKFSCDRITWRIWVSGSRM